MASTRRPRRLVHKQLRVDARRDGTYERLYRAQHGLCAICQQPAPLERELDLDHDHRTLAIRGLLCRGCNMRLRPGLTAAWMRAAADYLEGVRHAEA